MSYFIEEGNKLYNVHTDLCGYESRRMKQMPIVLLLISIAAADATTTIEIPEYDTFGKRYKPEWDDLDTRPLPQWYDEAKVGIFLHWGVYCVPGFESEWFWNNWKHDGKEKYVNFMAQNYPPGFTYQEFAPMFKAEFFDALEWAKLFVKSGAKYIVLTSKHHEGYTLFPSKQTFSWNSVDVGPKRDIVGELTQAVRSQGLEFGVYHSLYEWFNPMYLEDKENNFSTQRYVMNKLWPDFRQLIHDYEPAILWSDGDWEAYDSYWKSEEFLAWLYNDSPVSNAIVVNDRWGIGTYGKHGDFFNFADRFNNRTLQPHKWENAFTVDSTSWGYNRNINISQVLSVSDIIDQVVTTVSCGGNALINVGPTKEGTIAPIFQDRLLSHGKWLAINGEAIYKSSPWLSQNDTYNGDVWYTCTKTRYNALRPTAKPALDDTVIAIYAIALKWPKGNVLKLQDISVNLHSGNYQVELLGDEGTYLKWKIANGLAHIHLPDKSTVKSENAWTLKFTIKY